MRPGRPASSSAWTAALMRTFCPDECATSQPVQFGLPFLSIEDFKRALGQSLDMVVCYRSRHAHSPLHFFPSSVTASVPTGWFAHDRFRSFTTALQIFCLAASEHSPPCFGMTSSLDSTGVEFGVAPLPDETADFLTDSPTRRVQFPRSQSA